MIVLTRDVLNRLMVCHLVAWDGREHVRWNRFVFSGPGLFGDGWLIEELDPER